mmetsp:Transcript_162005/g.519412  ORF Transcript_162005/g.519412 Transcript_162005/m.519412 type:complete len:116 (+) Transcript_162005:290-637(+)
MVTGRGMDDKCLGEIPTSWGMSFCATASTPRWLNAFSITPTLTTGGIGTSQGANAEWRSVLVGQDADAQTARSLTMRSVRTILAVPAMPRRGSTSRFDWHIDLDVMQSCGRPLCF